MAETNEQEILSRIRTLLALERNFLAQERTALAQFRTGLALALIAPVATTVSAYIFYALPTDEPHILNLLSFAVFAVITAVGVWITLRSRFKLEKIWKKKTMLREHQVAILKSYKATDDLLGKLIVLQEQVEDSF